MKLEIKDKKENPLLSRIEVSGIITFDKATPSNDQVAQSIASQLKVDASLIKMKHIYTGFGERQAKFSAFVYKTKEALDKIEPKPKKQLEKEKKAAEAAKKAAEEAKAPKEEAKPAEAPAEKPAEAKPEEKKEEAKPEEKKEEAKPEEKKEAPKEEKKEGAE